MVAATAAPVAWPSSSLSVRAFQCWMTVYRRIWRSSIWSSLLGPLFYLGAMGLGLGTLVDRHGTASLGGVSYLAFVAPAILASGAMNAAMSELQPVGVLWSMCSSTTSMTAMKPRALVIIPARVIKRSGRIETLTSMLIQSRISFRKL